MKNKKSYIIIPNVAFAFGSKYHLDKDAFMLFAHLQMMKQIGLENKAVTMVDMLVNGLRWETSTKPRDKKRVVNALERLQNKGYIEIEHDSKILKDILSITINKELESSEAETKVDWKHKPFVWKGFTKVSYEKYNLADNNGYHLMAICYTTWRNNAKYDWRICIKEWEGIFGVTDKTAREILSQCENFITKISGNYYEDKAGQVKQEANEYIIQTVSVESSLQQTENKVVSEKALDKAYAKVTDKEIIINEDIFNQIFDKKTRWRFNGYKAWKETTCSFVEKGGQDKFNSMKASPNKVAGEVAERLEREYQEYLSKEGKRKEILEQKIDIHLGGFDNDYEEYTPSYIKKETPCLDFLYED